MIYLYLISYFCGILDTDDGMGVCFCLQESAKAALNMKACQMTDRTTQTEHMGPEVRHTQTAHTSCLIRKKTTNDAVALAMQCIF